VPGSAAKSGGASGEPPPFPPSQAGLGKGAGVRSGDEPGAVITAARVAPKAADEIAAVNAPEAADRGQRTGGEREGIVAPELALRALGEIGGHRGVRTEHRVDPAAGAARARDLLGQIDLTDEIVFETAECRRPDHPQNAGVVKFLHRRFGPAPPPFSVTVTLLPRI
jgi:hypothetical protein